MNKNLATIILIALLLNGCKSSVVMDASVDVIDTSDMQKSDATVDAQSADADSSEDSGASFEVDVATSKTEDSISLEFSMGQNMPARVCFYPTESPAMRQCLPCQWDSAFGAVGNEHSRLISSLAPDTSYTVVIQSSVVDGASAAECETMPWEDVHSLELTTERTPTFKLLFDPISDRSQEQPSELGRAQIDMWEPPLPPSGDDLWLRVLVIEGEHYGIDVRNPVLPNDTEGWISYWIRLVNWDKSQHVMKLPGPSAHRTEGAVPITDAASQAAYDRVIGGFGGGGAGGTTGGPDNMGKSWSARMAITPIDTTAASKGELYYELYHRDSASVQPDGRVFAERQNWREGGVNSAQILDENWHRIKHYIRLNDIGEANGILRGYLDGVLAFERSDINFADNPEHRNIALMLNIYHGGSVPATDRFTVYMDGIRYNRGPVDLTN